MINKINDWIAIRLTWGVSTMWCFYAFFILVIIPLFIPSIMTFCMYFSSSILQLIFLPLILVGSKLMNQSSEERAAEDHAAVMEIMKDIRTLVSEEDTMANDVADIKRRLAAFERIQASK